MSSALSFGMLNAPAAVRNTNSIVAEEKARKTLTENEQAVVDRVVEDRIAEEEKKKGKALTNSEKKKIYNTVFEDMENGGISTDIIEEVLGGDTYTEHSETLAKEKELQEEYDTLYKMKNGDKSDEQIDRQAELKKQLEEINTTFDRQRLGSEVFELVRNDRLAESYYENDRKFQDFVADFSKFEGVKHKEAARKTLENAIKAGANNTRAVRNFVEWVARTSGDTGLSYDFKSGDKMKADFIERQTALIAEMEKIPEAQRTKAQSKKLASLKELLAKVESGETVVNGDITENGIVLNLDTAKPLNRVVGHEITHSLEQSKHYKELRDALFAYAKNKNIDVDSKLAELTAIYEGVENANPEAELVADLVGDFLFGDADFINDLSTNHRTVAKWVYDQIDYLHKLATAGSKEARQLEKLKKAFKDAYRAGGKAQSGTSYSVSEVVGASGKSYGIGVHLDSDLLTGLSDTERVQMVKTRVVEELAGNSFIAYDNGNPVEISIARKSDTIKNANGNKKPVLKELYNKYIGSEIKQEAVVLADELIEASKYDRTEPSNYPHDWLDNYGKNDWVKRTVYLQDKNKTVWKAMLHIANSADGRKILYDIGPIEMAEGAINSAPTTANTKVAQNGEIVKHDYSLSKKTDADYLDAVNRGDTETAQKMVFEVAKDAGYTVRAYHGTRRGDRVGNVFLPERATSGPMAFFTDSKEIAEHYAKDKADTSLAYDEEYEDYYSQFRVNQNGKSIKVQDLWRSLPLAEKQRLKEAGKHITWDENMENIVWDDDATHGLGNWDAYTLNLHKGNAIEALIDCWLESGELYGNEGDFIQVLEMAGIKGVEFRDPDARHDKVYDTLLKIDKPFDTADVNEDFASGFEAWYSQQPEGKYDRDTASADMWDKNSQTAETFLDRLRDDIADGTTHAWTSIPDSMTDYLKHLGYDGIKDTGGKNGGAGHTVWIPFTSEQIKSAEPVTYDDNGNIIPLSERFKADNPDIRYSLTDNSGKQLTKPQIDFFKESKMRDDNGNLVVMYHGSQAAGFHVFDAKMSDDDTSFFFVDRNEVAASYSGTSEVYEAKTIRTAEESLICSLNYKKMTGAKAPVKWFIRCRNGPSLPLRCSKSQASASPLRRSCHRR